MTTALDAIVSRFRCTGTAPCADLVLTVPSGLGIDGQQLYDSVGLLLGLSCTICHGGVIYLAAVEDPD